MIEVADIHKRFGAVSVLGGVRFTLGEGQSLGILGSSGCGKTTLLQILAGLLPADSGSFKLAGQEVLALAPEKRGVVYLSQEPLLFPHLNVQENIAFGLRIRGVATAEAERTVSQLLDQLGLNGLAARKPSALSGGQRQRVAFGRALVIRPKVLLLDEPFGSLDAQTRSEMQGLYRRLSRERGTTTIFVTHDLKEALVMGDTLARMDRGVLEVFAGREDFLRSPASGVRDELAFWRQVLSAEGSLPGTPDASSAFTDLVSFAPELPEKE